MAKFSLEPFVWFFFSLFSYFLLVIHYRFALKSHSLSLSLSLFLVNATFLAPPSERQGTCWEILDSSPLSGPLPAGHSAAPRAPSPGSSVSCAHRRRITVECPLCCRRRLLRHHSHCHCRSLCCALRLLLLLRWGHYCWAVAPAGVLRALPAGRNRCRRSQPIRNCTSRGPTGRPASASRPFPSAAGRTSCQRCPWGRRCIGLEGVGGKRRCSVIY